MEIFPDTTDIEILITNLVSAPYFVCSVERWHRVHADHTDRRLAYGIIRSV